jgi:predicted porin
MKKTLVALASLAALGTSFAQSSMTIYGNLDQTLVQTSQGGKSATSSASNNNSSSYWGITSTEDIGGGLKASFDLRSEITLLTGQAASTTTSGTNAGQTSTAAITQNTITNAGDKPSFFNRGAYLKLEQAGIGAVTIGRQADAWWLAQGEVNTSTGASGGFGNLTAMQTNSTNFSTLVSGLPNTTAITNFAGSASAAGANINPTYIGTADAFMGGIALATPTISGFSGTYQMGIPKISYNDAGSANNGAAYAIRYDGMGLSVRIANSYKNDYAGNKAWTEDLIGATYTMGPWKVALSNNKMKFQASATGNGTTATAAGVFYNMSSALTLNAAYGVLKDDVVSANKFTQTSFNVVYKLSPRSSIYGGIFNGKNEGAMKQTPIYAGNGTDTLLATVNAYTFGVRHTF